MKIEVIEKAKKVEETPFVVGGVYRFKVDSGSFRILVESNGEYATFALDDGTLGFTWQSRNSMQERLTDDMVYVPNARLVIED